MSAGALARIEAEVVGCRLCPRLVWWREEVARTKRAAYREEDYWAKPVPAFGDPGARLVIVGLAPGAHGSNRTGRMFTGDASGRLLYRALHKAGAASAPVSRDRHDGLRLRDVWITAPVRCVPPANKPTPAEIATCEPYMQAELAVLRPRAVLALGAIGFAAALRALAAIGATIPRPRPRFGHGVEVALGTVTVVASYHVSQQNTATGKLTEPMFDAVVARALELARM